MPSLEFSFIILTFNEERHLPRLLESITSLGSEIFILDSGSTDRTIEIAQAYGAHLAQHPFENHPKQWDYALNYFPVQTPWIIGLDADQIVLPELLARLQQFRDSEIDPEVDGIYFNRKNYFKGRWIRYGGYFPKYLLKMFRRGRGYSDLNENMDHRFIVSGKTLIWDDGYLKEENLKENEIAFWIDKHNRYSDLVAHEEYERLQQQRQQSIQPRLWGGSPDQRVAFYKKLWWKLPLYWRPFLYFFYRFFWKWGVLDGREGRLFHFLQGFWFRLIIDEKLSELKKNG